jgi:hypothetical protein
MVPDDNEGKNSDHEEVARELSGKKTSEPIPNSVEEFPQQP